MKWLFWIHTLAENGALHGTHVGYKGQQFNICDNRQTILLNSEQEQN